jgi:hypothetical protein
MRSKSNEVPLGGLPQSLIDLGVSKELGRAANRIEVIGDDTPFYKADRNNFQPRLGVAWDVRSKGHTVLRAGYGLFNDRLYQFIFSGTINNLPSAS